jgi:hypothetical protein
MLKCRSDATSTKRLQNSVRWPRPCHWLRNSRDLLQTESLEQGIAPPPIAAFHMRNLDVFNSSHTVLVPCVGGVYNGAVKLHRLTQASFWRARIRLVTLLAIVVPE